jgi:RHS repeat-associated protein
LLGRGFLSRQATGGWTAGTYYDTGTISVKVSDTTAQVNWVQGSTPSGLAATLAASINGLEGIPGSSCPTAAQIASATGYVSACASGGTVTLTSLSKGPAVDWSVTASAADTNPTYFSASGPNNYQGPPSFAVTTANMSGGEISGNLLYSYAIPDTGGYAPNGNLLSVADSVTGTWNYQYDNLNRVVTGTASAGSYAGAQMSWSYDPFGNRQSESVGGTIQSTSGPTPTMPSASTASYTAASNQVSSSSQNNGAGFLYDTAGNVLNDGQNRYLYDAEGRLCAAQSVLVTGSPITGYIYDAGGTRVAKGSLAWTGSGTLTWNTACSGIIGQGGWTFTPTASYVLGPGGEQVTEYAVSGSPGNYSSTWQHTNAFSGGHLQATYHDTGTYFYLGDWLGTKRVEVGTSGCAAAFTSLAYGDGLTPVTLPGYASCPDATEHHFTGKERDAESGNDYFEARYYSSNMGRFLSPDPLMASAHASNPQTWNRYAYVLNNPLRLIDPNGMDVSAACANDKKCQITVKVNVIWDQSAHKGKGLTDDEKKDFQTNQMDKAIKDYAKSGIKLDVTYTDTDKGGFTSDNQVSSAGLKADSLNIIASDMTVTGAKGNSGITDEGIAISIVAIPIMKNTNWFVDGNTSELEIAHQFLGDPYKEKTPSGNDASDASIAVRNTFQQWGVSQQAYRVGLEPARFASPTNPEAIKPQK